MSKLSRYIGSQFGNPRGIVGKICCFFMNRINKKMYAAVVSRLSDEKSVLDIGYGNGYLVSKIYKKTKAKISGIDISEDMMKTASKRNQKGVDCGDIKLGIGDCCSLEFADESFDAVSTVNTIYFWEDTVKGLKEIRRVLKGEGVFCNAVYTKRWMTRTSYTREGFKLYEKEEYIKMSKDADFSDVEIVDIVKDTNFLVVCRKKTKMLLDFLFGLNFVLMLIILLVVVMSLCPKWGFALANKEVKKEMQDYPEPPKAKRACHLI